MGKIPKPPSQRRYVIKHMWQKHHEIARLLLLGLNNKDIAERLGCTPQNISDIRNSPIFQDKMDALSVARDERAVDIFSDLQDDAPNNTSLLKEVRDGKHTSDIRIRVNVAQDLLDRAGYGKVTKIAGAVQHQHLMDDQAIDLIKQRARQAPIGEAVDAEIVEETAQ